MKKFILGSMLVFGLVFIFMSFISAFHFPSETDESVFHVDIEKGWNLIYGFIDPNQIVEGDYFREKEGGIKAIYGFMPSSQEYVRIYPNPKNNELFIGNVNLLETAFWVYSDRSGGMEYKLYRGFPLIGEKELQSGWNLFAISPDFIFKDVKVGRLRDKMFSLNDVKGNCNIQDAYFWDAKKQDWYKDTKYLDAYYEKKYIGLGIVVKVSDDCNLGTSVSGITTPPAIPSDVSQLPDNGGSNVGNSYIIQENLGGYSYISIRDETPNCHFLKNVDGYDSSSDCKSSIIGYYSSQYNAEYDGIVAINHFTSNINNNEFIKYVQDTYIYGSDAEVEERLLLRNNVFLVYDHDSTEKSTAILWYSGDKIIFITSGPFELSVSDDPLIEGILQPYLDKYPSDLNF